MDEFDIPMRNTISSSVKNLPSWKIVLLGDPNVGKSSII